MQKTKNHQFYIRINSNALTNNSANSMQPRLMRHNLIICKSDRVEKTVSIEWTYTSFCSANISKPFDVVVH